MANVRNKPLGFSTATIGAAHSECVTFSIMPADSRRFQLLLESQMALGGGKKNWVDMNL